MNPLNEASLRTELARDARYLVRDGSTIRPVRVLSSSKHTRLRWRKPLLLATALIAVALIVALSSVDPVTVTPAGGQVQTVKATEQTTASATSPYRYEDDGTHPMPSAVRKRASSLLKQWDAWITEDKSAGTPPTASYYADPLQSAAVTSITNTSSTRTLSLTFNGGGGTSNTMCGTSYYPTTLESASAVAVYLTKVPGPAPKGSNTGCDAVGERRTVTVDLRAPLMGRPVLDVLTGKPIPVTA